ncbi:MAG: 4'-phosphopantetheinyl transferase [Verrucomicrobia bacterium]|nr:MAG: 4'-phosphopantetheinyl transferase [Verrucomicrobiota bacterium]
MVDTLLEKSRAGVSPAPSASVFPSKGRRDACPTLTAWYPPSAPVFDALAHDAHIWVAGLDLTGEVPSRLRETLSRAELQQVARFHFDKLRDRFVAAHGILRVILSRYLRDNTWGKALEFKIGPYGKPALAGSYARCGLQFNLSHSDDLMLLAVTRAGAIGVDIERIRPMEDATDLVERFFSPRENSAFRKLPAAQQPDAFFNLWTRKEAWLKATGEGIGSLLNRVEVSFYPEAEARLLRLPRGHASPAKWTMRELSPASGYAAAVAIEAPNVTMRSWKWEEF